MGSKGSAGSASGCSESEAGLVVHADKFEVVVWVPSVSPGAASDFAVLFLRKRLSCCIRTLRHQAHPALQACLWSCHTHTYLQSNGSYPLSHAAANKQRSGTDILKPNSSALQSNGKQCALVLPICMAHDAKMEPYITGILTGLAVGY